MRTMSVRVRKWKGAWWVFINHQGVRKAKRIGKGEASRKAAQFVAGQLQARVALGEPAIQPQPVTVTIEGYARTFLERIEQTRKHTTHADYRKILDHYIFPFPWTRRADHLTQSKNPGGRMPPARPVPQDGAEHLSGA